MAAEPDESPDGRVPNEETHPDGSHVDSDWWYAVAAVPVYFVLVSVVVIFLAVLLLAGVGIGVVFDPVVTGPLTIVAVLLGVVLIAMPGMALAILFPLGTYLDARAIAEAPVDWDPDAVLWGGVALVGVVATNFIVSVPLALYYLYRRHEAIGEP